MSTTNVQAFLERATSDAALRAQLENPNVATLDNILLLAREQGLPFSAEDWQSYAEDSGALSDADLSAVSGGERSGDHRIDALLRIRQKMNERNS